MVDNLNNKEKLNRAIDRGTDYLFDHQLPNGEFLFYMSNDDAMLEWNLPESSIFPTAIIGTCLLDLKGDKRINEILLKSAHFLKHQMDRGGTWNHYTKTHRWRKLLPQDLDDTACVSYFLEAMNFTIPSEYNKQIMIDNRNRYGLFYTWLTFRWRFNKNKTYWYLASREIKHFFKSMLFWHTHQCTRYDIDAVVNANILFYVGKCKETSAIAPYLTNIIKKNKEDDCDTWYRNTLTVYYFISRNIATGINELQDIAPIIVDRILKKQNVDGSFGESSLDNALAISSLIYSGYKGKEINNAIAQLLKQQNKNGNWDRRAFYYGGPKKLSSFGSEELTTAFCLEALVRFKNL